MVVIQSTYADTFRLLSSFHKSAIFLQPSCRLVPSRNTAAWFCITYNRHIHSAVNHSLQQTHTHACQSLSTTDTYTRLSITLHASASQATTRTAPDFLDQYFDFFICQFTTAVLPVIKDIQPKQPTSQFPIYTKHKDNDMCGTETTMTQLKSNCVKW